MEFGSDSDALARIQAATDYPLQRAADGRVVGHFFHCRLSSLFQPVFDVSERQVLGHAAYVHSDANDDGATSAWGVFALATEDPLLVRLDRLCRTLHALNYFGSVRERQILFLAVQPRLLESVKEGHGRAFEKVLDLIGVETSQVVIAIPAEINRDRRLLKHVIVNYRSRGYRIALDHGAANSGWMAELGSLNPDFVRLTAGQLQEARATTTLADEIHRSGSILLVTDVDTGPQMTAAIRAGADLLQGQFVGAASQVIGSISPSAQEQCSHPGCAW